MIPIIFDKNEIVFTSNGLGRLRDCISCIVTEERNGIYECDFEYPVTGANFDLIQCGRVIGVTHDDSNVIQPFDIVSYSKPLDGIVSFHCVHISYRQSGLTTSGTNINSLTDAFTMLSNSEPANPFNYETDISSTNYMAAADGVPRTVRQMLGGIEGSILDSYGGEFEWDRWTVRLHSARGLIRDFSIRYGVNMLDFNDEADYLGTFTSCVPYWIGQGDSGEEVVKGNKVDSGLVSYTGKEICMPLDLSEKFEDKPTPAQLEAFASREMISKSVNLPRQTITVDFIRLQDFEDYANFADLLRCGLCDIINVIFPDYSTNASYKIVRTEWNVLRGKYEKMELGHLSTTLAEALGISMTPDNLNSVSDLSVSGDLSVGGSINISGQTLDDFVIDEDTNTSSYGVWHWRKWKSGRREAWGKFQTASAISTSSVGGYASDSIVPPDFPTGLFTAVPHVQCSVYAGSIICWPVCNASPTATDVGSWRLFRLTSSTSTTNKMLNFYVIGS